MYSYKITNIRLNDDSDISPGNLVVLVGPNNVGKSRALRDIATLCAPAQNVISRPLVVKDVNWISPPDMASLKERGKLFIHDEPNGARLLRTLDPRLAGERNYQVTGWGEGQFDDVLKNKSSFAQIFGSQFIGHLDTQTRLQLVQQTGSPQFRGHSTHLLQSLYWKGKPAVAAIQKAIKNQFDLDLALDFSRLSQIVLRVGKDMEQFPDDPRDALEILEKYERLDDQGDGLRSFTGIVTAILCADRDVYLIDEPEAFLHPPQAFRIGELLAKHASSARQIFVATHSSDVLQGLFGKAPDATIIRVDRLGDANYFRTLNKDDLKAITVDPLLQSARVLDGIFYPAAMIVEGDSDARFYRAASHKAAPRSDVYTVNAQNKQTVARVSSLYKKLGIRCVGVVDFDVLNDSKEFARQLESLDMDETLGQSVKEIRNAISAHVERKPLLERAESVVSKVRELGETSDREMDAGCKENEECLENLLRRVVRECSVISNIAKPWSRFKEKGRDLLPEELQDRFDQLAKACLENGLCVNPYGELESLLVDLGIEYTTDKKAWIQRALALLPNLQVDESKTLWTLMAMIHSQLGIEDER